MHERRWQQKRRRENGRQFVTGTRDNRRNKSMLHIRQFLVQNYTQDRGGEDKGWEFCLLILLLPTPLYCIVLYLYIYIVLLAVHTNQKRFQCERPREKRAVLRERKEALGSPVNKVDRVEGRSWFQSEGPMIAKARV